MAILASYPYPYFNKGDNREIQFSRRDSDDPTTIQAIVLAFHQGEWIETSRLSGGEILVEMMSTTERIEELKLARQENQDPECHPERPLSDLSLDEQQSVLGELNPRSGRRIEVMNDIGGPEVMNDAGVPEKLERVVQLTLFDPR